MSDSASDSKKIRLSQDMPKNDVSEKNVVLKIPKGQSYDKLDEIRRNNQLCDVKLIAKNGKEIMAHKVVLSASSEYFNVMFNSGFKESRESEVIIQDLDPHVLSLLVDFIYTSELVVTEQNIQEILSGIIILQLDESICNECVKFIKTIIDSTNCLTLKETAECLGLNSFYSFCLSYTLENYKDVVENEEFLLISFDQILQIIKSEDLCANEEVVYKSVIKWVKHDLENRNKYLPDLLEYVRLPLVSPTFLKSVDAEPLLKSTNDCTKYLTEAYAVQTVDGTGLEASNSIRTHYRPNYAEYVLIMNQFGKKHLPLLFNVVSNKWKTIPAILPYNNGGFTYMLSDGRIIEFGGFTFDTPSWQARFYYCNTREMNSSRIYDITENRWITTHPMHDTHNNSNIVQIGCRVYVIGCYKSEYYNIELDKWFKINSFKTSRTHYEMIALNGLIYAVGGEDGKNELKVVEKFDPKSNTCTLVAPMIHGRVWPTLCEFKGCIYAMGGLQDRRKYLNTVEKYDPNTDTWEEVANLNYGRSKAGAVSINGSIYVFGGLNSGLTIEVYNPYKNKWSVLLTEIPTSHGYNNTCYAFVVNQAIQNKFLTT